MLSQCPKCGHAPLPAEQAFPAECPACGVILARAGRSEPPPANRQDGRSRPPAPERGQVAASAGLVWSRVALLGAFAVWGLRLCAMDYRDGEIAESFIHGPLLVFHEAGHVIFRPLGEWMTVAGGTLGQLLMPAILAGALWWKNRDAFGAAIGLWLLGVSLLDVSAYMFDAWAPQLTLLGGGTGNDSFHDWIYLFDSVGQLRRARATGAFTHALGVAVVLVALGGAGVVLWRQWRRPVEPASTPP